MRSAMRNVFFRREQALAYMLQQVNYDPRKFIAWVVRNYRNRQSIYHVMHRQKLVMTRKVMLVVGLGVILRMVITLLILFVFFPQDPNIVGFILLLTLTIWAQPFIAVILFLCMSIPAYIFVVNQRFLPQVKHSEQIFKTHPAVKVAVAGSYGKTTFKELLTTVLSQKYVVATTPGNMNTPVAHARFAQKLNGKEDVLIIEYGEEHPGDVINFWQTTHPDYAVITGLAPNHLEYYRSLDRLAADLLSLRSAVAPEKLYITGESGKLQPFLSEKDNLFTQSKVGDWKIEGVKLSINGTKFKMSKAKELIHVCSRLLGQHHVAPLAMAAALGVQLGLSTQQVEAGIKETKPFEHRMQALSIGGANVIDDTYNGNIEGVLAGLELLDSLPGKRKIYVTPGLVDQGKEKDSVHHQIAKKIANIRPDILVLMKNSSTHIIQLALEKLDYKGKIMIENDPLNFYTHLDQFVAKDDLIIMQNDWTDNYS